MSDCFYSDSEEDKLDLEPPYEVLTVEELQEKAEFQAKNLAEILDIPFSSARYLLYEQGTPEKVLENISNRENLRSILFEKVEMDNSDFFEQHRKLDEDCNVCYSNSYGRGLSCGHDFCDFCWRDHVKGSIKEGVTKISCMGVEGNKRCDYVLRDEQIFFLFRDDHVEYEYIRKKFRDSATFYYISMNRSLKLCPNVECHKIIKLSASALSIVCSCGRSFCAKCDNDLPHEPLPCSNVKVWLEGSPDFNFKSKDEIASLTQISQYKFCPYCNISIDRNEGCKFMTCGICRNYFCFICLKKLKEQHQHHDPCIEYNGPHPASKPLQKHKIDVEKKESFNHYKGLYTNYLNIVKTQEMKLRKEVLQQAFYLRKNNNNIFFSHEVNLPLELLNLLIRVQYILAHSFACLFYLSQDSRRHLFEDNLNELSCNSEKIFITFQGFLEKKLYWNKDWIPEMKSNMQTLNSLINNILEFASEIVDDNYKNIAIL